MIMNTHNDNYRYTGGFIFKFNFSSTSTTKPPAHIIILFVTRCGQRDNGQCFTVAPECTRTCNIVTCPCEFIRLVHVRTRCGICAHAYYRSRNGDGVHAHVAYFRANLSDLKMVSVARDVTHATPTHIAAEVKKKITTLPRRAFRVHLSLFPVAAATPAPALPPSLGVCRGGVASCFCAHITTSLRYRRPGGEKEG